MGELKILPTKHRVPTFYEASSSPLCTLPVSYQSAALKEMNASMSLLMIHLTMFIVQIVIGSSNEK